MEHYINYIIINVVFIGRSDLLALTQFCNRGKKRSCGGGGSTLCIRPPLVFSTLSPHIYWPGTEAHLLFVDRDNNSVSVTAYPPPHPTVATV